MENQLDIFDLKAVQIKKSKQELIKFGQQRQTEVPS